MSAAPLSNLNKGNGHAAAIDVQFDAVTSRVCL